MRPPPSPRKGGEAGKALQLYGGKAQVSRDLQMPPSIRPDTDRHFKDPLYIGLPNYGNSCYQNATLQSLLGLRPFLSEMMALISGPDGGSCRTLCAVAKLMVLRQKALGKSVSSHLNDLREVFASIDPAFRGNEMQDANEFLLRLLDTIKDEIDARRPAANPVRDNFEYQTIESYMCTNCHKTVLKRQDNISWFVSVPRRQGSQAPTLQDALRLSMRSDERELHCEHCKHNECRVTTKISKLPRTLILQLNRYVFLADESKKIRANVEIPKFLSLNEYVADDATRPPEWKCTK
ncbi:ubiquitin carboxyl-terminal hydrolase 37-like [Pollicipes pollicipes]|uniref:ubiquitin carboxyl-terminal hydrolase 37-like n=1 Tax=Pollicipes pollicipes TaxID=41117 RepID=UPI00188546AC|nr:ubiquitin carboxyl-terminal hydrolase 37-like [Pollicipes pollicipes]